MTKRLVDKTDRIVVKVGTSVLTYKNYILDKNWIEDFVNEVVELIQRGKSIAIVSSGAIACGMGILGLNKRPKILSELQACAAIGQSRLMNIYEETFSKKKYHVAQILLTGEDMFDRHRYLNAKTTIETILKKKAVPIINENDTVAVDEIKFGDNDRLSSLVANLIDADLLIMLTDVDGLYGLDRDKISIVKEITPEIEQFAEDTKSEGSLGGMNTKLEAARIATNSGISCVIVNGREQRVLNRVLEGEAIGTLFLPRGSKMKAKKRWLAYSMKAKGVLVVDEGAKQALIKGSKSLLACGIKEVEGKFGHYELVSILDSNRKEFARGLSNYNSEQLQKIKGRKHYEEVVHRDNLVIL